MIYYTNFKMLYFVSIKLSFNTLVPGFTDKAVLFYSNCYLFIFTLIFLLFIHFYIFYTVFL